MTKSELIEMTQRLYLHIDTEEEQDLMLKTLDKNVPHPAISDLIYWPPENKELSPEEVIDIALEYDWKSNQKIVYSNRMTELLSNIDFSEKEDDDLALKYFKNMDKFDVRSYWDIPLKVEMKDIAAHNSIDLSEYESLSDQLNVVSNLERYLKVLYPNRIFQSYFILNDFGKAEFSFHPNSPNADWIMDFKIPKLTYPIRKNTF